MKLDFCQAFGVASAVRLRFKLRRDKKARESRKSRIEIRKVKEKETDCHFLPTADSALWILPMELVSCGGAKMQSKGENIYRKPAGDYMGNNMNKKSLKIGKRPYFSPAFAVDRDIFTISDICPHPAVSPCRMKLLQAANTLEYIGI
jgi:hypothetical protein